MSIKVMGKGHLKMPPDQVTFHISLTAASPKYQKALSEINDKSQRLIDAFLEIGFTEDDLKTDSFFVNRETTDLETVFKSYQSVSVVMDFNHELMNQSFEAINKSSIEANFDLSFSLKDEKNVQAKLFKLARDNAYEKAKMLADIEGVRLGDVIQIDALDFQAQFKSNTMLHRISDMNMSPNITPHEIDSEVTIFYEWRIKERGA